MKIRLALDSLEVQSFETGQADRARGTVQAHNHVSGKPECYSDGTCVYPCESEHGSCEADTCALTDYLPCCGG